MLHSQAPYAEAVAVSEDGRILEAGDLADIRVWEGPNTDRVDLQGAWLLPVGPGWAFHICPCVPKQTLLRFLQHTVSAILRTTWSVQGLIDAHVHLIEGGLRLLRLDLTHVQSKATFVHLVTAACGALPSVIPFMPQASSIPHLPESKTRYILRWSVKAVFASRQIAAELLCP